MAQSMHIPILDLLDSLSESGTRESVIVQLVVSGVIGSYSVGRKILCSKPVSPITAKAVVDHIAASRDTDPVTRMAWLGELTTGAARGYLSA